MQFHLKIKPRKFAIGLALASITLATLSLMTEYIVEVIYRDMDFAWLRLIDLFSVNLEESIPTWYSTMLLFLACMILLAITLMKWQAQDAYGKYWAGLALIFLYLSMDEGAVIHEVAADPLVQFFNTGGYLYFGWQIVFAPLVLIFALLYLQFLLHLPAKTRYGFIASGLVYVGGAVVVEGFSADLLAATGGIYTYRYLATATLEEFCEMIGIVVFIYALLEYIVQHEGQFSFISTDHQKQVAAEVAAVRERQVSDKDWLQRQIVRLLQHPQIDKIALFVGSVSVVFIQWIALRETTALVQNSELVTVLMIVIFIVGWVIAFILHQRLQKLPLLWIAVSIIISHVSLPVWFRLIDAQFSLWIGDWLIVAFTIMVTTVFYSLYLPTMSNNKLRALPVQFAGIVSGIVLILLLGQRGYYPVIVLYTVLFFSTLFLFNRSHKALLRLALIFATWLWFLPALTQWSNTVWYHNIHELSGETTTIFSNYSLSQKIDVLQDNEGSMYLYQNGVAHFDPINGVWQNIIMGRIPASILQPDNALVIGTGSMQMELMIANYAEHVTTIESDAVLAAVSRDLFTSYNFMDTLDNRTISIANPQSYLEQTNTDFDLIAIDLPDVYDLQTGTLLAAPFFELVSETLSEDGVFVVNLTQAFAPDQQISRRIAASLLLHFEDVIAINSRSTSYAFASQNLSFSGADVQVAIEVTAETEFGIFESDAVRAIVGEAQPIHDRFEWLSIR